MIRGGILGYAQRSIVDIGDANGDSIRLEWR